MIRSIVSSPLHLQGRVVVGLLLLDMLQVM
jgi:hypothetical protein